MVSRFFLMVFFFFGPTGAPGRCKPLKEKIPYVWSVTGPKHWYFQSGIPPETYPSNEFGQMFSPERSEDPTGCYWKKLHHKKQTLNLKMDHFNRRLVFQPLFSGDIWVFRGVFFFDFLPGFKGKSKTHWLVLPGGPTGQFAAKPTAAATENGHSARLDLHGFQHQNPVFTSKNQFCFPETNTCVFFTVNI